MKTNINMQKMKFECEVKYRPSPEFGQEETYMVAGVTPKLVFGECPHCQSHCSMKLDAQILRQYECYEPHQSPYYAFDLICSCSDCQRAIFIEAEYDQYEAVVKNVYPRSQHIKISSDVPLKYAEDYREATLILDLSPKASAALSRRILQNILREEYKIQDKSLAKEIDSFISSPHIPQYLSQAVDAIRNIGNIAAHPIKDTNTGEIVDIEPGEAEWLLEVLDVLFDFTFMQPQKLAKRRQELNTKLQSLGKPPMKG